MKILKFFKKHMIATSLVLVILTWGGHQLWPLLAYKYFYQPPATHVESIVLNLQPATTRWQAMGTVKAARDIIVASEVAGTIENTHASNGQPVHQGDELLSIRHNDISAALQKDEAILAQKELFFQRLQKLVKKNAISQEAVSQALSDYHQAQAAVKADQAQLDRYIIKAPFSGILGIWQIDAGQLVQPGTALVTLTELSPAYIDFMLPAKALDNIKVGDLIHFTTNTFSQREWQGKIVAIEPQLDNETRSIKLRAEIDNRDHKLVPRLYGQVTVIKRIAPHITIPQEAITYDPQGASVFVLEKNVVQTRHVTLGEHQGEDVVIMDGLKPGDEIITAGMMKLFPGMPVTVNKRLMQPNINNPIS